MRMEILCSERLVSSGFRVYLWLGRWWSDRFIRRSHTLTGELAFNLLRMKISWLLKSLFFANTLVAGLISRFQNMNLSSALADQGYRWLEIILRQPLCVRILTELTEFWWCIIVFGQAVSVLHVELWVMLTFNDLRLQQLLRKTSGNLLQQGRTANKDVTSSGEEGKAGGKVWEGTKVGWREVPKLQL